MKVLQKAVDTVIISTAECERCFSVMNDIVTPIRNSLKIKSCNADLYQDTGTKRKRLEAKVFCKEMAKTRTQVCQLRYQRETQSH